MTDKQARGAPALRSAEGIPAAGTQKRGRAGRVFEKNFLLARNFADAGQLHAAEVAGQERGLSGTDGEEKLIVIAAVKGQIKSPGAVGP